MPNQESDIELASHWFAQRTSHWRDWPQNHLLESRMMSGESVSVVVPTLNEQDNIAHTVTVLDQVRQEGLIDEILVVDSGSTDRTCEFATNSGADVLVHAEIAPSLGTRSGKGEALWKGLIAARGDVVVYVDADIRNFASHFVLGLLGPLLEDPDVALVKGFFDRPYSTPTSTDGGRVTELVARPLLGALIPLLSYVVQPMGGEYAGRRRLLEHIPFAPEYAVDVAMLVDVVQRVGLEAIAQVDLGTRIHDHQDIQALGRMSATVVHSLMMRAEPSWARVPHLVQFTRDDYGVMEARERRITTEDRPPLHDLGPLETLTSSRLQTPSDLAEEEVAID